jgi:hypothetical protein
VPTEDEDFIRHDNGGRRSGLKRRQFSYSDYVPEAVKAAEAVR